VGGRIGGARAVGLRWGHSVALLALMASALSAQEAGPWYFGGGGFGSLTLGDRPVAYGGYVYGGLAGQVTRAVALGGESAIWSDLTTTHVAFAGVAHLYPSVEVGLFGKVGLGLAYLTAPSAFSTGSAVGVELSAGVGYEFNLGERLAAVSLVQLGLGGFGNNVMTTRRIGLAVRTR